MRPRANLQIDELNEDVIETSCLGYRFSTANFFTMLPYTSLKLLEKKTDLKYSIFIKWRWIFKTFRRLSRMSACNLAKTKVDEHKIDDVSMKFLAGRFNEWTQMLMRRLFLFGVRPIYANLEAIPGSPYHQFCSNGSAPIPPFNLFAPPLLPQSVRAHLVSFLNKKRLKFLSHLSSIAQRITLLWYKRLNQYCEMTAFLEWC